jgi:hypothetical protein
MFSDHSTQARKRTRIDGGGYRRDHLRALAQRVEVANRELRIMGSKSNLLTTLAAISGVKSATASVRSSGLVWRRERNCVRIFSGCGISKMFQRDRFPSKPALRVLLSILPTRAGRESRF